MNLGAYDDTHVCVNCEERVPNGWHCCPGSAQEREIRASRLDEGDLESLKAVLDRGHGIGRGDGYALIAEINKVAGRASGYRSQLKNLAALCGMASAKLCAPVSEGDLLSAKRCVETGVYVMRQLLEEEKSA